MKDHRASQHHLQAKVDDLSSKYSIAEEARARLETELQDLQGHFSLNLDEKTQQLQSELQVRSFVHVFLSYVAQI